MTKHCKKIKKFGRIVGVAAMVVGAGMFRFANPTAASSGQDPLLQMLQDKGMLTEAEAVKLAKERPVQTNKALQGLSVGMLGFIDYSAGKKAAAGDTYDSYNKFSLTRGYLTVKKKITPWLGARVTTDIHRDSDDNYMIRLKYLYAEFKPGDLGPLTKTIMEVGQGHNPWLDFEEHVNPYRVLGTMAVERAGVFNSADLGVSIRGGIGGELADAKARTGNHHYDGLYGSWHLGVYNGGGYHADEVNQGKAIEGRLTVRPLPEMLPGLQFSYLGMFGEGNKDETAVDNPDYSVNLGLISYEHPLAIFTAQYFTTTGNASGAWTTGANKDAIDTKGYSIFGRVRLPFITRKLAVLARYDHFDQDADSVVANDTAYDLVSGGLSYEIVKGNMIVLAYETTDYENDVAGKGKIPTAGTNLGDEEKMQIAYQLKF